MTFSIPEGIANEAVSTKEDRNQFNFSAARRAKKVRSGEDPVNLESHRLEEPVSQIAFLNIAKEEDS
ncbi:hypothetical protein NLI96_g12147 [Meripilus lineatus]|uniref:Uncharacterized protein n=1 Tax=Meripilus lineatus TaxID=2056292 RepID=A0AAD5UQM8_9APHY|nr:hypothetical protein NLI96_g12147 [Physisporinus lineatus]